MPASTPRGLANALWMMPALLVACTSPPAGQGAVAKADPPPAKSAAHGTATPDVPTDTTPKAEATTGAVKTSFFNEITLADGEVAVMDGGIHGVQGHRLRVVPGEPAKWTRSLDSLQPSGAAGSGDVALTPAQLETLRTLCAATWEAAAAGPVKSFGPVEDGPPRWVWVVAMRRGDETRLLQGGAQAVFDAGAPPSALALLRWTADVVDGLASTQ